MDRIFEELQRLLNARLAQAGETEGKLAKIAGCSQWLARGFGFCGGCA